jgi:hypothetical protein
MNVNIHACLAINGCYTFLNLSNSNTSSSNYLYLKYKHKYLLLKKNLKKEITP